MVAAAHQDYSDFVPANNLNLSACTVTAIEQSDHDHHIDAVTKEPADIPCIFWPFDTRRRLAIDTERQNTRDSPSPLTRVG